MQHSDVREERVLPTTAAPAPVSNWLSRGVPAPIDPSGGGQLRTARLILQAAPLTDCDVSLQA